MADPASTPPDASADFDRATRQALRLVAPGGLRLITSRHRPSTERATPEDAAIEDLAISIGVLTPRLRRP